MEAFGGFDEGGQTAVLNLLKNRWQRHVAVRVVAFLEGLRPGKRGLRGVQGHVAVRVVALEACGSVWGVLGGLRAGKRQS